MKLVEQGIRAHALAGSWRSDHGDKLLIGCSGAFNADWLGTTTAPVPGAPLTVPATAHESGSHISEITSSGFTVSRWPLASDHFSVDEWPHQDPQGRIVMQAEGTRWVRTQDLGCD